MLPTDEMEHFSLDTIRIGKRIRKAREEKNLTQEYLADLCECTPTHICKIENGKTGISLELLFKISIILEKSMDYFVMDHPKINPRFKIDTEIAAKLIQCDQLMLDMVINFLDDMLSYRDTLERKL